MSGLSENVYNRPVLLVTVYAQNKMDGLL